MKFLPLTDTVVSDAILAEEYKTGREIGVVKLTKDHLFFKKKMKVYYIPYTDVRRCFRRVRLVPAKLCCGKGDFEIEYLVVCGDAGELAEIQLPGTRAAKILIEELKERIPDAKFVRPDVDERETVTEETDEK